MPDEVTDPKPCPCSWSDKARAAAVVIAALAVAIPSTVGGIFGVLNHQGQQEMKGDIATQSQKADTAADAATEARDTIQARSAKTERAVERIEKVADAQAVATKELLFGNWQYLKGLAGDTDTPASERAKRQEKADKAHAAYQDHCRKFGLAE